MFISAARLKISALVLLPVLLTSCTHHFETAQSLLPIEAAINESGVPIFYVDRYSLLNRYGIRGIRVTKDNASACELENNNYGERSILWGYEIATTVQKGDKLNPQNLEEFPKEIAYGVIPPKVAQKVTTLEKNTIYHADISIVVSRNSKVYSFRRGDIVFTIDNDGEIISRDLKTMCELEKALEKNKALSDSLAQVNNSPTTTPSK